MTKVEIRAFRSFLLITLLFNFGHLLANAQITAKSAAAVMQQFERPESGAALLRGFCSGSELRFRADGTPAASFPTGIWTLDGFVQASKVTVQNGELSIEFRRLGVIFEDKKMKYTREPSRPLLVVLPTPDDELKLRSLFEKMFYAKDESFIPQLPPVWREYFEQQSKPPSTDAKVDIRHEPPSTKEVDGFTVYTAGKGVSPPSAKISPDPDYNPIAKKAGLQGTVVLWIIVGTDGRAHAIKIKRPLGLGLDEDAIATVEKWKFSPARYQGQLVATQVNLELPVWY